MKIIELHNGVFFDNNFTLESLATNHHNNHISIIVNEIIEYTYSSVLQNYL